MMVWVYNCLLFVAVVNARTARRRVSTHRTHVFFFLNSFLPDRGDGLPSRERIGHAGHRFVRHEFCCACCLGPSLGILKDTSSRSFPFLLFVVLGGQIPPTPHRSTTAPDTFGIQRWRATPRTAELPRNARHARYGCWFGCQGGKEGESPRWRAQLIRKGWVQAHRVRC